MKLWNKLAQDTRLIAILLGVNVAQFIVILGLLLCIAIIPTRFTFYMPPDLSNGVSLKANEIPNSYVGEFAFYIWQILNNWQEDGAQDAFKALQQYGYYMTPEFKYYLQKQDEDLKSLGELQGRIRVIRPDKDVTLHVEKIDGNTWQVIFNARESEYVNGILVKDKVVQYPFKVIRYNGNAQFNPFGLVLDGFTSDPQILNTLK